MTHAASAYGTSWQFARGKAYCRDAAMLQWMAVEAADAVRVAPLARVLALVGLSIAGKAVACRVTGVAAQAPVVLVALHAVRAVLVTTAAFNSIAKASRRVTGSFGLNNPGSFPEIAPLVYNRQIACPSL